MFVQFAVNVMGVEGSFREPEAIVMEGIRAAARVLCQAGATGHTARAGHRQ